MESQHVENLVKLRSEVDQLRGEIRQLQRDFDRLDRRVTAETASLDDQAARLKVLEGSRSKRHRPQQG